MKSKRRDRYDDILLGNPKPDIVTYTPTDVNLYRVDNAEMNLCPACARTLRAAGATVEVLRAARGKCARCGEDDK